MNKSGTPSSPYYQFGLLSKEEGLLHFVSSGEQGNCSNLSFVDPDAFQSQYTDCKIINLHQEKENHYGQTR